MSVQVHEALSALRQAQSRAQVQAETHRQIAAAGIQEAVRKGLAEEWQFFADHWESILLRAGWETQPQTKE
jgi:hypothetical protein